jgi:hypothetical protein
MEGEACKENGQWPGAWAPCVGALWGAHLLLRENLAVVDAQLAEAHFVSVLYVLLEVPLGGRGLCTDGAVEGSQPSHCLHKIVVVE